MTVKQRFAFTRNASLVSRYRDQGKLKTRLPVRGSNRRNIYHKGMIPQEGESLL